MKLSPGNSLLAVDKMWRTTPQTMQEADGWLRAFREQYQSCGDKVFGLDFTNCEGKKWAQSVKDAFTCATSLWQSLVRSVSRTSSRKKGFWLRNPATSTTRVTQIVFFSALLYGGWVDKGQWKEQHEGPELSPDDFRQKILCENVCSALFMCGWLKV